VQKALPRVYGRIDTKYEINDSKIERFCVAVAVLVDTCVVLC
jgi:hypothetical protein